MANESQATRFSKLWHGAHGDPLNDPVPTDLVGAFKAATKGMVVFEDGSSFCFGGEGGELSHVISPFIGDGDSL